MHGGTLSLLLYETPPTPASPCYLPVVRLLFDDSQCSDELRQRVQLGVQRGGGEREAGWEREEKEREEREGKARKNGEEKAGKGSEEEEEEEREALRLLQPLQCLPLRRAGLRKWQGGSPCLSPKLGGAPDGEGDPARVDTVGVRKDRLPLLQSSTNPAVENADPNPQQQPSPHVPLPTPDDPSPPESPPRAPDVSSETSKEEQEQG
uniref:Uncharacterized protein n=1 Tax=Chromera velia CCMP2878 TaxID=1169474 RepID=A0A0G4IF53_9ALVE|eukprot:Cvel_13919.t1-p1 / transcript=Cvel_13919.t1 / gene=Cvel_13919 / organism=Chromera_velia_CCMP2878 / gene_product=hypothetical protein / transcript_product=hypothetical protein / location=Cvel_scaffold970:39011-40599(+) / protein_length=206 / sequence_SO=supercontig / SO=protein_coding / is_pseudo=false